MLETRGLILLLVLATFIWLYDHFFSMPVEKEDRLYWIKALAIASVVVGIFFWFILMFWAPR